MDPSGMTSARARLSWISWAVALLAASGSTLAMAQGPVAADGAADRTFAIEVMTTIAEPVLDALSRNELKARMPVRDWEVERDEPFASRFLGKIAPTGGILGEISLRAGPKLYSIGP